VHLLWGDKEDGIWRKWMVGKINLMGALSPFYGNNRKIIVSVWQFTRSRFLSVFLNFLHRSVHKRGIQMGDANQGRHAWIFLVDCVRLQRGIYSANDANMHKFPFQRWLFFEM
jgi:hypothetical protein